MPYPLGHAATDEMFGLYNKTIATFSHYFFVFFFFFFFLFFCLLVFSLKQGTVAMGGLSYIHDMDNLRIEIGKNITMVNILIQIYPKCS